MKRKMEFLEIIVIVVILFSVLACSGGTTTTTPNYYGNLTITNTPVGASFYAQVYQSNVAPTTRSEYNSITTAGIAVGSGVPPIQLNWAGVGGVQTGTFLVRAFTGSDLRFILASFNNGNATVNWNLMTSVDSLP